VAPWAGETTGGAATEKVNGERRKSSKVSAAH
jgi:hypothetical protein